MIKVKTLLPIKYWTFWFMDCFFCAIINTAVTVQN